MPKFWAGKNVSYSLESLYLSVLGNFFITLTRVKLNLDFNTAAWMEQKRLFRNITEK